MDVPSASGLDEWEICNDNGFVYKRRRRSRQPVDSLAAPSVAEDSEAEQRWRPVERMRLCLLNLRDRYGRELELWEHLSASLLDSTQLDPSVVAPATSPSATGPPLPGEDIQHTLVDELLSQVEAQEAILRKISEICDYVESLCREKEESLVESLLGLPIWGSPRSLMTSLAD